MQFKEESQMDETSLFCVEWPFFENLLYPKMLLLLMRSGINGFKVF